MPVAARAVLTTMLFRALAAVLATVVLAGALVAPAAADTKAMPGNFTGYAFDTCDAPSQGAMNDWRRGSKYWGVGIYIAGLNRACETQPNLTRRWVSAQARKGWRLLPLVVGRQAACAPDGLYEGRRISKNPAGDYRRARRQGQAAARSGAGAAQRLGIGRDSVLWFDLEHFDTGKRRCRLSALAFTSSWTKRLHRLGYRSGFYSSASSGISLLDDVRRHNPRGFALPDYLWVAEWNGRDTVRSSYISEQGWWPNRRVHQYRGPHDERHGGSTINIDSNFLRTGRGTVARGPSRQCGVRVNFAAYRRLERGDRDPRVRAAECFLRREGHFHGSLDGRFGRATQRAVRRFQEEQAGVPASGVLTRATWTSLLSAGRGGLVKYGSGGRAVRRLQRALNAATDARLRVDGVFSRGEMRAVKGFQRQTGRADTGVVTSGTWKKLRRGRTVGRIITPQDLGLDGLLDRIGATRIPFSSGVARD
jgi:peptidoglycan hydrolase-like protein with peptidoglycan-binding domain